jgi:hydroxymethylpyrimidine/phosphomethylpyrimidine kinase
MLASSSTSPVVLTIAGFDPSGGAGIIADIRTIVAFGCTPVAAVTSLTLQSSEGVFGAIHQTAASLRAQILPVVKEFHIATLKIGMLPTRESVMEVVRLIQETDMPAPVVDPVLRSTSGYELMEPEAREVWLSELMLLARLITPNIPEAEILTETKITNEQDMREAAHKLREMGARAVLIKGGHLKQRSEVSGQRSEVSGQRSEVSGQRSVGVEPNRQAIDLLDDEGNVTMFRGDWIDSGSVRGTGCMLSSAIAACLGRAMSLQDSVGAAKRFVAETIRYAPKLGSDSATLELTEMTRLEK